MPATATYENSKIENFLCPNCGGIIKHDIKTNKFICSSCGQSTEANTVMGKIKEYDFNEYNKRESSSLSFDNMQTVYCQNCGAEIVFDKFETAKTCPMCGSSQVAVGKQKNGIPPEGVIPFKIDQYDAQEKFKKWVKTRWFAPNNLKRSYQEGALRGIYIPFWTYDSNAIAQYSGRGGTYYTVEEDGKEVTKIRWTNTSGIVTNFFDDVQICASQKEFSKYIDGILPYDTINSTQPYSPSYLSGYIAEHYALKADECFETAKNKMISTLREIAHDQIIYRGFDIAEVNNISAKFTNIKYKHVLLPIWSAAFSYNSKNYQYIINGETGKVNGSRPYSIPKIVAAVILALLLAIGFAIISSSDESQLSYSFNSYSKFQTFSYNNMIDLNCYTIEGNDCYYLNSLTYADCFYF